MEEGEASLVAAFGANQIVHIVFDEEELACGAAFNLELPEAHRKILIPDRIGADMMGAFFAVIDIIAFRGTVDILFHGEIGIIGHPERLVGMFLEMFTVSDLLESDMIIFVAAEGTLRYTGRIDQQLAFFFMGNLFEDIELVVEIIIENNHMVIAIEFFCQELGVGNSFAGRACDFIAGILLADIGFENW